MLKDVAVRKAKPSAKPRKLSDGGGLHVLIQPTGSKFEEARRRREDAKKLLARPSIHRLNARPTDTPRTTAAFGRLLRR
jgi:hypothetical protein